MTYNLTALANSGSVYELVVFSNNAAGGSMLALFVLALFFIMVMSLKKYEFDTALLVSSFACFMISALLVYAELMGLIWALLFLVVAAFSAFFKFVLSA